MWHKRQLERCGRRRRLRQRIRKPNGRLTNNANNRSATLRKLYNCPKTARGEPHKPLSQKSEEKKRGRTSDVGNGSPLPPPVSPNQNHLGFYCLCTQRCYSLYRLDPATKSLCSLCHNQKKAKLLTPRNDSWNTPCCNACYGRLLSTRP